MTAILEPSRRTAAAPDEVTKDNWMRFARCQDEPTTFVIATDDQTGEEPPYPTTDQERCCQLCPVRELCLAYALDHKEKAGVWGGMTEYQRRLLMRWRSRKSCPGCGSFDVVSKNSTHEFCIACGISWYV